MTTFIRALIGASVCAAAMAACGGGGGGTGANGTDAPGGNGTGATGTGNQTEDACNQLAVAECKAMARCDLAELNSAHGGSEADCVSRNKAACLGTVTLAGVTAAPAAIVSCAQAWDAYSCAGYLARTPPAACVLAGSKGKGSSCAVGWECQTGVCLNHGASGCGICVEQPSASDSCDTSEGCGQLSCSNGECTDLPLLGDDCSITYSPCNPLYYCDAVDTCSELSDVGAECYSVSECNTNMGLICNHSTNVCEKVPDAKVGENCSEWVGDTIPNCKSSYCTSGTCEAWAADGGSCDSADCRPPAICAGGKCVLVPPSCQ